MPIFLPVRRKKTTLCRPTLTNASRHFRPENICRECVENFISNMCLFRNDWLDPHSLLQQLNEMMESCPKQGIHTRGGGALRL